MNGDCQWITTLHYAFQDENYLVRVGPGAEALTWRVAAACGVLRAGTEKGVPRRGMDAVSPHIGPEKT